MLKPLAFANAIAVITAVLYVLFYYLSTSAPEAFNLLFNAQFLGAEISSLIPSGFSFNDFLTVLVSVVATGWVTGYLFVWIYNRFAKM